MVPSTATMTETYAQERVQQLADRLTRDGEETGLQIAAYHNGQLVVDVCAGVADPASGAPVDKHTLFMAFSASKGVTATVIHQLVEAGKLEYDTPVARYWPEFGARGKAGITVRHVLCHQAGIPQAPRGITPATLGDPEAMARAVAQLRPLWKPGSQTGYHGLTFGVILGELARRADGRPFAQIVQENICQPLGIDDLFFGIPAALEPRVATIHGARVPWWFMPPFMLIKRMAPAPVEPGSVWNHSAIRRGVIPAGNMICSARALARHYAALCGEVDGVRLLPPERVTIATALQTNAPDRIFFGGRIAKALGYWIGGADSFFGPRPAVFGHTGAGGSIAFADLEHNFSLALLKNRMTWRGPDDTDQKVTQITREALGLPA